KVSDGDTNNLAIVGLNVMRKPVEKKKAANVQKLLALVRVANFRAEGATVRVKLDVYVDDKLTHFLEQPLKIVKRNYTPASEDKDEIDEPGEASWHFELPPLEPGRNVELHAYLDKPADD